MASINKVTLIGRVGKDPEIRYLASGEAVANFSMATSTKWKDKNTGELKELTEWHNIVFYKRPAEVVGEYVHKGSQIYVDGSLRTRKYQDKNGQDRQTTEVIGQQLLLLDKKGDAPAQERRTPAPAGASADSGFDDMNDDIPF